MNQNNKQLEKRHFDSLKSNHTFRKNIQTAIKEISDLPFIQKDIALIRIED